MEKRLVRPANRMIGGVCAGIAQYFGWDPTIVRIVWLILTLLGTIGLWPYLILWLLMPSEEIRW